MFMADAETIADVIIIETFSVENNLSYKLTKSTNTQCFQQIVDVWGRIVGKEFEKRRVFLSLLKIWILWICDAPTIEKRLK